MFGCWLLVVGCWLLVVGCWLLVVGCWYKFLTGKVTAKLNMQENKKELPKLSAALFERFRW